MHAASIVRRVCLLWAVACLLSCQALRGPEGMLGAQLGSIAHEAFIGWGGETYLPPAATPNAAAPAEPLLPETSGIIAPNDADSATVDQLQDIPAEHAPIAGNSLPASAPAPAATSATAAPTVASEQHTIDVSASKSSLGSYDDESSSSWIQHLSWHPRLHLHHNLLTPQECDKMRELLARPSGTVGGANGGFGQSAEDEEAALMLMIDVEQRVANWSALPPNHLEGWQVQHGFTRSDGVLHTDLLTDRMLTEDYQRYRSATVLLFLGDDTTGAAASSSGNWSVVFPLARGGAWRGSAVPSEYAGIIAQGKQVEERLRASQVGRRGRPDEVLKLHIHTHESVGSSSSDGQGFCDGSVQAGLTLKGFKKGDALLVWNMLIDGATPDAAAAHLFCTGGDQATRPWIATTWMHNMPYGQDSPMALASVCEDTNPACSMWASQGFCDDAPGVMIGLRGMCRHSCQDCKSCDSLRPFRSQATGERVASGEAQPSLKAYMDCVYGNMHSHRKEWSEAARDAGTRKARNAIRRDMRFQAANGIATGHASPSQQQSSWSNVW